MYDLFGDNDISFDYKLKSVINQMSENDIFLVNQKSDIFSMGYQLDSGDYLSFGIYQEFDFFSNFPKEIATLFFEGTSNIGKRYEINNFKMQAELLGVYHIGLQKKIDRDLNIGGRLKLYSAGFNVKSTKNYGYAYTDIGTDGLYRHGFSNVKSEVQTSGLIDVDNETINTAKFLEQMFITGGKGLGLDFGVTYDINEELNISSSLTDLGFLYNFNTHNYQMHGEFKTEGINLLFNPNEPLDYWEELDAEFDENLKIEVIEESYISWRPVMLATALRYSFGTNRGGECNYFAETHRRSSSESWAGALLRVQKRPGTALLGGSVYYERNYNEKFQARVTYTADTFNYTNIGLATSLQIGNFNIFGGVNDIIGLTQLEKANAASVQIGMHILVE